MAFFLCKNSDGPPQKENRENNKDLVKVINEMLDEEEPRPRNVELYFYLWKVHDISTVNQCFSVTVTVAASWIEDKPLDNFSYDDFERVHIERRGARPTFDSYVSCMPPSHVETSSTSTDEHIKWQEEETRWLQDSRWGKESQWGEKRPWVKSDFEWHPQLSFRNVIGEDETVKDEWFRVTTLKRDEEEVLDMSSWQDDEVVKNKRDWYNMHKFSNRPVRVTQYIKKKVTLSEKFELENFPFDYQPLHIHLASAWDYKNVLLIFNKTRMPCTMDPDPLDHQEWNCHHPQLIAWDNKKKGIQKNGLPLLSAKEQSITGARYSKAYIAVTVTRKPGFYIWNIYVMLLILGSLSLSVFSFDVKAKSDTRMGILLTLVLAIVAFKYVIAQSLPSLSYLTMMDIYTLWSMMLLFSISMYTSIVHYIYLEDNGSDEIEKIAFIVSVLVWGIINLYMWIRAIVAYNARTIEINKINKLYNAYKDGFRDINTNGIRQTKANFT